MYISESKPIRIRIVSGGEEHSSLETLKKRFVESDIARVIASFVNWLGQIGENEVKSRIETIINQGLSYDEMIIGICKEIFHDLPLDGVSTMAEIADMWGARPEYSWNYNYYRKVNDIKLLGDDTVSASSIDEIVSAFKEGRQISDDSIVSIQCDELVKLYRLCNSIVSPSVNIFRCLANDHLFAKSQWTETVRIYLTSILIAVYKHKGSLNKLKELLEEYQKTESDGYKLVCSLETNLDYHIEYLPIKQEIKKELRTVDTRWRSFSSCIATICNYCVR